MKLVIAVLNTGLGGRGTPLNLSKIPTLKSPAELTTQIFLFNWKSDSKWFDSLSLACSMFTQQSVFPHPDQSLHRILKDLIAVIILSLFYFLCCLSTVQFSSYLHNNRKLNFCLFSFVLFSPPHPSSSEAITTILSTLYMLQGNQEKSFDKLDYNCLPESKVVKTFPTISQWVCLVDAQSTLK